MPHPEEWEKRAFIRISELANSPLALLPWSEIEQRDPVLSVEGLQPFFSAYRQFLPETGTGGLLYTNLYIKRPSTICAIHVVGPTGVGKDAVLAYMNLPWVLSDTERPQEERDIPDKTYHFVTKEEMDANISAGKLIEYTRVPYRDGKQYRYGTNSDRVLEMVNSGTLLFAFRTNQDGFLPITRFCDESNMPIVRVLLLPHCAASEYFDRVRKDRGEARVSTAKAEIQWTPELYSIDAILGNPFDAQTGKPERAAQALTTWLKRIMPA